MCLFLIRIQPKNSKQAAIFYKGGGGGVLKFKPEILLYVYVKHFMIPLY